MKQRQSIVFPRPGSFFSFADAIRCTKYVAARMIDFHDVPQLFIKEDFCQLVMSAFSLNYDDSEELSKIDELKSLTSFKSYGFPIVVMVEFLDMENVMCIVGTPSQYYVIDIFHGICYTTTSPEYDIESYIQEYGSTQYVARVFSQRSEAPPVATVQQPAKKKQVTKKKPVEVVVAVAE